MYMSQSWAMWAENQPERIFEGGDPRTTCKPPSPHRLDQLSARVLKDIGVTKHGILETPFDHHR